MPSHEKIHGIHYTPDALAGAVADRLATELRAVRGSLGLSIIDPACGDGGLVESLALALRAVDRKQLSICAFDIDPVAVEVARERLAPLGGVRVAAADFLSLGSEGSQTLPLFDAPGEPISSSFDVVIANPPYVRTQVLGAERAQALAARYGLTGRVDLAYAFVIAIIDSLRNGGYFAIILSNKFLTIRAGAALRKFLQNQTDLLEIWDLGDSRLFSAAVLPVVIFGRRKTGGWSGPVRFRSLYEVAVGGPSPTAAETAMPSDAAALQAFATRSQASRFSWNGARWECRVGHLAVQRESGAWILEDDAVHRVQKGLRSSGAFRFGDVLRTSVGIKTTADNVFIRSNWAQLPQGLRPEEEMLRPIRMTRDVERWYAPGPAVLESKVLYPYDFDRPKRTVVDLSQYPRAAAYLEAHRAQLEGRRYIIGSGRRWFEPWVPHQPSRWKLPRLVFRDIAAEPTFCVDESGAIPNGTLYWSMSRVDGAPPEYLWAACAIANSRWAGEYYDLVVGTRLYAGRRRYNTQALNVFPFPALDEHVRELAELARAASTAAVTKSHNELARVEQEIESYCRKSFASDSAAPSRLVRTG